jgi:hypothetical protein
MMQSLHHALEGAIGDEAIGSEPSDSAHCVSSAAA